MKVARDHIHSRWGKSPALNDSPQNAVLFAFKKLALFCGSCVSERRICAKFCPDLCTQDLYGGSER